VLRTAWESPVPFSFSPVEAVMIMTLLRLVVLCASLWFAYVIGQLIFGDELNGWQGVLTIVVGFGLYVAFFVLYGKFAMYLPICLQRPIYNAWKEKLSKADIHPLVNYPLQAYIAFSLDAEFEKGGICGAQAAIDKWMKEFPDKLMDAFKPMTTPEEYKKRGFKENGHYLDCVCRDCKPKEKKDEPNQEGGE
jgi:hypothetical protein